MDIFVSNDLLVKGTKGTEYRISMDELGSGDFSVLKKGEMLAADGVTPTREVAIKFPIQPLEMAHLKLYEKEMQMNYSEMMKRSSGTGKDSNSNSSRFVEIVDYFMADLPYQNGICYPAPIVIMKKYKRKLRDVISERSKKAQRFQKYEIISFISDFLWGLKFLYKNGKSYCQFSIDTIFIDDEGNYVIGDYAISKELKDSILSESSRKVIFDYYSPPEFAPSHKYDVYMFGAILYEMITFRKYKIDLLTGCVIKAGAFEDLIGYCVHPKPEKRPDVHGLDAAMKAIILKELQLKDLSKPLDEHDLMAFYSFCPNELDALYPERFNPSSRKPVSPRPLQQQKNQPADPPKKFIGPLNDPVKNPLGEGKSSVSGVLHKSTSRD